MEYIEINCSKSLSFLFIEVIVPIMSDESFVRQLLLLGVLNNLTFNNSYVVSPSAITYTWSLLPSNIITTDLFPFEAEADFVCTNCADRLTDSDTWRTTVKSISGCQYDYSGNF
jgi:hypothetical protein